MWIKYKSNPRPAVLRHRVRCLVRCRAERRSWIRHDGSVRMVMARLLHTSHCGEVKLWGRTTEPALVAYDFPLPSRSTDMIKSHSRKDFSERRMGRRLYLEPTDHLTAKQKKLILDSTNALLFGLHSKARAVPTRPSSSSKKDKSEEEVGCTKQNKMTTNPSQDD